MKVELDSTTETVVRIGKVGIERPGGEYVGLTHLSGGAARELAAVLEGFVEDPARADHWYEHAIQCHLDAGADYGAVDVPSGEWVEIDDEADLVAARRLRVAGGSTT
jgi:choline kinase